MPRKPRKNQVDLTRHSTYHVISRCTRQLFLLGTCDESREQRKGILLSQLQRLARFTAIGVGGFSVMDNHLHLLLKVDVALAQSWSAKEVAERWLALHPPRNGYFKAIEVDEDHIAAFCTDHERVESCREKLMSLSQFMKELKQETTQQINKLDNTVGSLWAGRFKCNAVTNETQLLATMAYIDLNPFAAGACEFPEHGQHTSLDARLNGEPVASTRSSSKSSKEGSGNTLQADRTLDNAVTHQRKRLNKANTERHGWWLPIGAVIERTQAKSNRSLHGQPQKPRLSFKNYLLLLDASARLLKDGKKQLASDMKSISQRLSVSPTQVAAQVRYWREHGFSWARLESLSP